MSRGPSIIGKLGAVTALALAVSACGGGGSSSYSPAPSTKQATTTSAATTTKPATSRGSVTAAAGKKVFQSTCAGCHTLADAGTTGTVGPNLDDLEPSMAAVVKQVTNGGGGMPAFGGQLTKTQIQSIAKYVSSVAGKGGSSSGGSVGGAP